MRDDIQPHDFLFSYRRGTLTQGAVHMPEIRNYIENLNDYTATFSISSIGIDMNHSDPKILEMLGAWKVPPRYVSGRSTKYVNPNYKDKRLYGDITIDCECGATINQIEANRVFSSQHTDECVPYQRFDARARLERTRYHKALQLLSLGLYGNQFAARIGLPDQGMGQWAKRYHMSLRAKRAELFYPRAGLTYHILTRVYDVPGQQLADIYGLCREELRRYAQDLDLDWRNPGTVVGEGKNPVFKYEDYRVPLNA